LDYYLAPLVKLFELRWTTLLYWLDILIVTFIVYRLFLLIRGPRAWRIVVGVMFFIVALVISRLTNLLGLHWILDKAALLAPVALVILLLPELRQGLERLGSPFADRVSLDKLAALNSKAQLKKVEEIVEAVTDLAANRIGAIIVIERASNLDEIVHNGVQMDATITSPLLVSIFYEGNPLHDGAVIIRQDKILAAACRLPLSESPDLSQNVHMRHRAAVGVTEATDAFVIVVSEERGTISYAMEGKLRKLANHVELREVMNREVRAEDVLRRRRERVETKRTKEEKESA
jgi:diadenylate cyclase